MEKFRDQSASDLDELEQLKNDSMIKMEVAMTERDTALEQLHDERIELGALRDAQVNSASSDPGILALHERVRELGNVCIEQSKGRAEYKQMYDMLV